MAAAIFGLVGVVVGAFITGGVDFLLESRREHKELQKAKRLVASELTTLHVQLEVLTKTRTAPRVPPRDWSQSLLPSKMWAQHNSTLAGHLNDQEWSVVDDAYGTAEPLKLELITRDAESPLEDDFIVLAQNATGLVENAQDVLRAPSD